MIPNHPAQRPADPFASQARSGQALQECEAADPIADAYTRGAFDGAVFVFCAIVVAVVVLCVVGGGW